MQMQSFIRGVRGRRVALAAREERAARVMQEIQQEILREKQEAASLSFQTRVWRPYRARTAFRARVVARDATRAKQRMRRVTVTQNAWRARVARSTVTEMRAQRRHEMMHAKACRVQSCTRGFLQRRHEEKRDAAIAVQKTVRARQARTQFVTLADAVLRAQTVMRGFLAKKEMRLRRRLERLDRPTSVCSEGRCDMDEEEEDALAFLSPVSFDPFVTYRTFSDSGVSLAREVMVAVEQAEKYAAAIERDLMGIDGGHVDDSEEDDESAEEEGGDDGAGASGEEEKAHLPVASALFGLINASGLSW